MTRRRTNFLRPQRRTPASELASLSSHPAPSMTSLLVISGAITILALCTLFTAEVVLQHLGIPTLISGFVGAGPASPAFAYNVLLIGIPIVGAILGTVFLVVFAIFGGLGDDDAHHGEVEPGAASAHEPAHGSAHGPSRSGAGLAIN